MVQINTQKALKLIRQTKGKVFTAVFTKKDGSVRKINCRLGVSKKLNGTGLPYNPADHNLLTVFDMKEKDYRMINLETLAVLQIAKEVYVIIE